MSDPLPKANVILAADAVTTLVKAVDGASMAVMDLVPSRDFSKITSLQIYVAPQGEGFSFVTRGGTDVGVSVGIAILKRLSNKSEIPEMILFAESIANALCRKRLSSGGVISKVEFGPLYDTDFFEQLKLFFSVINIEIKDNVL